MEYPTGELDDWTSGAEKLRWQIAKNVRRLRKARDMTQHELSSRAGIDRTYLARLETRALNISVNVIFQLAMVLEVEAWQLLKTPSTPDSQS